MEAVFNYLASQGALGAFLIFTIVLLWYFIRKSDTQTKEFKESTDKFTDVVKDFNRNEALQNEFMKEIKNMNIKIIEKLK
jgi:hypothetical protein